MPHAPQNIILPQAIANEAFQLAPGEILSHLRPEGARGESDLGMWGERTAAEVGCLAEALVTPNPEPN